MDRLESELFVGAKALCCCGHLEGVERVPKTNECKDNGENDRDTNVDNRSPDVVVQVVRGDVTRFWVIVARQGLVVRVRVIFPRVRSVPVVAAVLVQICNRRNKPSS